MSKTEVKTQQANGISPGISGCGKAVVTSPNPTGK